MLVRRSIIFKERRRRRVEALAHDYWCKICDSTKRKVETYLLDKLIPKTMERTIRDEVHSGATFLNIKISMPGEIIDTFMCFINLSGLEIHETQCLSMSQTKNALETNSSQLLPSCCQICNMPLENSSPYRPRCYGHTGT